MGIIVNQNENRSELQKRIAAELTEKAKKKNEPTHDRPDGIDDSAYIEGTKQTTTLAWLWLVIVIVAVGILVWFFVMTAGNPL